MDENESESTQPLNLNELMAQLDRMKEDAEEVVDHIRSDEQEIKILEKRLNDTRKRKSQREQVRFNLNKEISATNHAMEALKRQLALEAENRRVTELANARRQSIDELTQEAKWREYALPHQYEGALYLSSAQRAVCADGMGTGKTLQILITIDMLHAMGDGGHRVLIACPNEVVRNFVMEFHKWSNTPIIDLSRMSIPEAISSVDLYDPIMPDCVYVINYDKLARSDALVQRLNQVQFDTVVCDEAHKIKETSNSTYQALEILVLSHNTCPICGKATHPMSKSGLSTGLSQPQRQGLCPEHAVVEDCTRSVKNYYSMTGTLILNRPNEAYASLHLINDKLFPTRTAFEDDFCQHNPYTNKLEWRPGGESRLVEKIKGMYIRRTREDAGIKLPPQTTVIHSIELDPTAYPRQHKLLRQLAEHAQMEIDEGKVTTFFSVLPLITRQRQASVWPGGIYLTKTDPLTGEEYKEHVGARYLESAKMDKAVELYKELAEEGEERVLILSQFKEPLIEFARRIGPDIVEFHGGTPKWKRDEIVRNFDRTMGEKPKWKGVAAHYKLGGEGLNLTAVTQVIVLDEQWNPGMAQQAYDRVNRMGQTDETCVHIIRLENSIDDWLANLIESKKKIVDGFHSEIAFQDLVDVFKNISG